MEDISNFILDNITGNADEVLNFKVELYGADLMMSIDEMFEELLFFLDFARMDCVEFSKNNFGIHRATLISFKYDGRRCDIGEYVFLGKYLSSLNSYERVKKQMVFFDKCFENVLKI